MGHLVEIPLFLKTSPVFMPLHDPCRYKGVWGGRGSGKSHFFAEMMVEKCFNNPGTRAVCVRENQKSLKESAKRLIEDKIQALGLGSHFIVQNEQIITPGGGLIVFVGMKDHTKESIKSLEGFNICWVEEAQTLSAGSMDMLRPTIRAEGSEIWFSWNPRLKNDPVDQFLRAAEPPPDAIVIKANWNDNNWFPEVLEKERQETLRSNPDNYDHIWEGGYETVTKGAFYASHIAETHQSGRVCNVSRDPHLPVRAFWDIGGTGARSDARAIWIGQFVGKEIRLLDYRETQGQELGEDLHWLHENGYERAIMVLPHDGATNDKVYNVSYQSALMAAGFTVKVVPNQGKGAAAARIEAARQIFSSCWFNEPKVKETGLLTLGHYHEKIDEIRQIGLGPNHDWSSHCADAFGLMAISYQKHLEEQNRVPVRVNMIPTAMPVMS